MEHRFRAPLELTPTLDEQIAALATERDRWLARANAVLEEPVRGALGQQVTVSEAIERAVAYRDNLEYEVAEGSHRHRPVRWGSRFAVWLTVALIDLPLMFVITSSVFNVDWSVL
jgi:hypothetical protein